MALKMAASRAAALCCRVLPCVAVCCRVAGGGGGGGGSQAWELDCYDDEGWFKTTGGGGTMIGRCHL
jgi:hypothetical protein